ncbi:LysR family transcriptional regulator [Leptospira sp. 2 VSF19]|uniref:LysR family transcriptional regulator n=1 Tax=Leptospira soteropolitanensis TaxID=2950025 RepID=A0AAW5VAI1_9LEPT|nr:LysR family transcriptional regulator [Leptospira soteropolitanensis]MCW7492270.1 LysR family transcriptional regulator [Leptospira soteropolitanensis]MCW7499852.1 LysR family transcriptional regulator [Leptospira soteropolitanensis]MCW7522103.1 LysR family transcriptional regulator [Leptospira soteropolitanensis]MCW7525957.1 LysR family transcriptional regulator [Leptospira soteropolitanensis]MCW7529929.1 LysR family transcriptional regulator [Leptospira soteropolitanensis]
MNPIELYQSFYFIYRERNLTKAGKILGLSQPALSLHLQSLERHRKEVLFRRTSRDLIPTNAAKRLYVQIAGPIEELEKMEGQWKPKENIRKLRIGSAKEIFLEKILPKLSASRERFHVQYGHPPELLDSLEKKEIDLVITNQKLNVPGILLEELYSEKFVFVASKSISSEANFPFRGETKPKSEMIKTWMENQHWFVYSEDFAIVRRFWMVNFDSRPKLKEYSVLPNLHDILTALELGSGVSVLPTYLLGKKTSLYTNQKDCLSFENQLYLVSREEDVDYLEEKFPKLYDWMNI